MSPIWIIFTLLPLLGAAERFSCRGRILGAYYADAKSGCKAFHVCVRVAGGGVRDFRFFCPPGTLFHQEAQTCTDWGDDDPLACPADLYDGSFDLYKIGSGFDTKKLSSSNKDRDEEEFGLQRAETGDKRLQNSIGGSSNDLRTAHSSDFFSGQRERGRDDSSPSTVSPPAQRQSFRRPTTRVTQSPSTQYTTPAPLPQSPHKQQHYDGNSKRKLVRKRPIYYTTTLAPTTYSPSTSAPRQFTEEPNYPRPVPDKLILPPVDLPAQYKDEYVEVVRVNPKSRNPSQQSNQAPFVQSTQAPRFTKKEGLTELFSYEAPTTKTQKQQTDRPFRVRNSFNVAPPEPQRVPENRAQNVNVSPNGLRGTSPAPNYNAASATPNTRNFNSVSYEPYKKNYTPAGKQQYYNSPSTAAPTPVVSTQRSDAPSNLNTVAYNTNIGFNAHPINYSGDEDDGQYRPPGVEDDGQYRPELYERELLSGAHSLNIAASGNRLPEDQKPRRPTAKVSQPRPFRPAPTQVPTTTQQTTRAPEPTTTFRPPTYSTQRTFDYVQTYTTTYRPKELERPSTTNAPATSFIPEKKAVTKKVVSPIKVTTYSPVTKAQNKEDSSYDYAYYDSDPGLTEYDQVEEFSKTKSRS